MGRFRVGRQRGERDPTLGFRENRDVAVTREGTIQGRECITPLLLELLEKVLRPGGELERRIIGRALALKGLRDSLIRVPRAIGPAHPDVLAAELVTQGWEHAHVRGEAVAPGAPLGLGLQPSRAPVVPDHPLQGHVLLHGIYVRTRLRRDCWRSARARMSG
jgi:hypothetical protein